MLRKLLFYSVAVLVIWVVYTGISIWYYGNQDHAQQSDAIIVLGAAVSGNQPSPVFSERINHAITLFQQGKAPTIIFTGGLGNGKSHTESEVAATYAANNGIPKSAILTETRSRTTRQNLIEAKLLMDANALKAAIIVSDPLHLKRAVMMAKDLGLSAVTSPTPTTRYRSLKPKLDFLFREMYFYNHYLFFSK